LAEPKPPIVEIRNIFKSYHRENLAVPVLHDITFDIAEGEFLALMSIFRGHNTITIDIPL